MLELPPVGFRYSATTSNVHTGFLADWVEASVLFDDPDVAQNDIVDMLLEYEICPHDQQDLAHQIASEGWHELALRQLWGGLPETVSITPTRIRDNEDWENDPMRAFLVLLSVLRIYPDWARKHQAYVVQGDLFEKVVEAICPALLPGWSTYRAGWSPNNTKDILTTIRELCSRLFTKGATDPYEYISPESKDAGLDIVCYRSFQDEREAAPMLFLQCASGKNWREKVATPNPKVWARLLDSAVEPGTGIAAPFVIEAAELKRAALPGQVVVFDRLRMLSAAKEHGAPLADELVSELINWMTPRVVDLPRVD